MSKALILFFDTNNVARLEKRSIKDGMVEIDNKMFYVDESKPLLVRSKTGYKPLYIIKWSNIKPSTNINELKPPEPVKPEFNDKLSEEMSPEMLRKLVGLKILGNMIKTKSKTEIGGFAMLLLGVVLGAVIFWSLTFLKIVKL